MQRSGKLVILGILSVALASAAASWWFRYDATHRAAEFWGPEATLRIRDAATVGLVELRPAEAAEGKNRPPDYYPFCGDCQYVPVIQADITAARGLVHLRNALLESRSYGWAHRQFPSVDDVAWKWVLLFTNPDGRTTVTVSADGQYVLTEDRRIISSAPIAAGFREILPEMAASAVPLADSPNGAAPAHESRR